MRWAGRSETKGQSAGLPVTKLADLILGVDLSPVDVGDQPIKDLGERDAVRLPPVLVVVANDFPFELQHPSLSSLVGYKRPCLGFSVAADPGAP